MIRLDDEISDKKNNNLKMLLQIHDELIFEVEEKNIINNSKIIKKIMTSVQDSNLHSFSIPLLVDINSGDNWGQLH